MKKITLAALALLLFLSLLSGCAKNEAVNFADTDDLNDKRIGVYTGTIYDKFAMERFPDATILRYNSIADFVLALKDNKIDAAISNLYSARDVIRENPQIGILTDDVLSFPIGIGFSKNNPALREKFNMFLKRIKEDNSFDIMYEKWFNNDPLSVDMPEFEPVSTGDKVVLGVAVGDLPNVGYVGGQYVGFDIELIQTFAHHEKLNLEITSMDFGALIASLASGRVDMIADCIAITEERKEQVDFSDPYMEDKSAIIVLKDNLDDALKSTDEPLSMQDIAKMKVGVLQGSVHDSFMVENYPDTPVAQYKSYPDLILAVKSGKEDAGFITTESFGVMQEENKSLTMLVDNVFEVPIGMGFHKQNDALREEFNAFLEEIKGNGVYDDWVKRWYQDGITDMPVIENEKSNGKLVVGVVGDKGLPYAIIQNNELIGSDIELVERFGAYLGKEIVYSDMEFGNLIAAVSTQKIDMIASTLMITEERQQQIDFSTPYYALKACVFGAAGADDAPVSFFESITEGFQKNIIVENRYLLILDGLKTTGIISVLSIVFGTLLGALVCLMRMAKKRVPRAIAKLYITLVRGLPVLVLLMVIFYIVFAKSSISSVLVAVIAFGMNFAAYVAEVFRSSIESIDKGQTEAGIAGGFTKAQTFFYIVMPQAVRRVLPIYTGELITLVKMTSIVGYIAVQDLTKASDIIRSRTFEAFFPLIMMAVLYFTISAVLIAFLNAIERRTNPKRKRNRASREAENKKLMTAGREGVL